MCSVLPSSDIITSNTFSIGVAPIPGFTPKPTTKNGEIDWFQIDWEDKDVVADRISEMSTAVPPVQASVLTSCFDRYKRVLWYVTMTEQRYAQHTYQVVRLDVMQRKILGSFQLRDHVVLATEFDSHNGRMLALALHRVTRNVQLVGVNETGAVEILLRNFPEISQIQFGLSTYHPLLEMFYCVVNARTAEDGMPSMQIISIHTRNLTYSLSSPKNLTVVSLSVLPSEERAGEVVAVVHLPPANYVPPPPDNNNTILGTLEMVRLNAFSGEISNPLVDFSDTVSNDTSLEAVFGLRSQNLYEPSVTVVMASHELAITEPHLFYRMHLNDTTAPITVPPTTPNTLETFQYNKDVALWHMVSFASK